jgi:RNA polymerase sigma-70 factor (ECF subfamily)
MLAEEGAAIEVVYARHWARLERQLTWITRDAGDGQELAAEVFARLAGEIAAGRIPSNPDAWLHRVGRNLAASRGRHLVVMGRRAADLRPPPEPAPPESIVVMAETWEEIRHAINTLAPRERRVVALAARGYDAAEIGRALGRTPGAARTLLCRSRAKLRDRLREAGVVVGS